MKLNAVNKNVVNKLAASLKRLRQNVKLFLKLKFRKCARGIISYFIVRLNKQNQTMFFAKSPNLEPDNPDHLNKCNPKHSSLRLKIIEEKIKKWVFEIKKKLTGFLEKWQTKFHDQDKWNNLSYEIKKIWQNFIAYFQEKWKALDSFEYFKTIKKTPLLAKMNPRHPMTLMLLLCGLFFGCIFGYLAIKNYMVNKMLKSGAEPPIAVSVIKAEKQVWQNKFKAPGSLRAIQGIDVTTEIAGMVKSIEFLPGAEVNAGDVLVQLNADTEIAELHALEAQADLAKITYERDKLQYDIKAISKETLDIALADLNNKMALVEQQKALLAKKTIKAPFKGRLGISTMNLGQYLNAGDKVVTLQTFDPIYFDFYVPQQIINQISLSQLVAISSDALPGEIIYGKITTIDPKADLATRNVQVEATIPNPNHKVLPGMFAQAEVSIGAVQQYITLPQTAISFNPYGELVYLVNEKAKDKKGQPILSVKQSFVTVGSARGDQISILSGIKEGDQIVTSGQNKLKNGSIVFINNTLIPENSESVQVVNQ